MQISYQSLNPNRIGHMKQDAASFLESGEQRYASRIAPLSLLIGRSDGPEGRLDVSPNNSAQAEMTRPSK